MGSSKKILAFAGSSSRQSINKRLVTHAAQLLEGAAKVAGDAVRVEVEIEILDLNDYELPLYSVDRQAERGIPERAVAFFEKIGASDGLLISFAEHNGSYAVAYKNLFDWCSRIDSKVFQGKDLVLLATSPGGRGGSRVLQTAVELVPHQGGTVKASLSVPSFHSSFDKGAGALSDPQLREALRDAVTSLL